jgi:hypothetical protein
VLALRDREKEREGLEEHRDEDAQRGAPSHSYLTTNYSRPEVRKRATWSVIVIG